MKPTLLHRPLAITDIETTGLDAGIHEIIEIGVVVVDQRTLKIKREWSSRVKPHHLARASKRSLTISGYEYKDWLYAPELAEVMRGYAKQVKQAIFVGHNSFFDWSFLAEAFKQTGIEDPTDYHRLDLFTLAWSVLGRGRTVPTGTALTLQEVARKLGLEPEPLPHRALEGARLKYRVLKALLDRGTVAI